MRSRPSGHVADRHPSLGGARSRRWLFRLCSVAALAFVLSSCVVAIDPFVPESAATFDARLVGTWQEADDSDRAVIARGPGNDYTIQWTTNGHVGSFGGRLGRLGARTVLDVWPTPHGQDIPEPYSGVVLATHTLIPVEISANEITMRNLMPKTLQALTAGTIHLAYRVAADQDDELVLRGTTAEIRAALGPYLGRPDAFTDPDSWKRVIPDAR